MHVKPQTLHMIASKCPGNSERRELFDRHEVSMVCPGNMPIFVATTPLAPLVFQTAGMKCISGCKVWTKFLSVASLWMLQHQPSVLYLILAFWLKVYWKLAQKKMSSRCNDITTPYAKQCKGLPAARWVLLRGYKCIARENDTVDGSENPRKKPFGSFRGLSDVHV